MFKLINFFGFPVFLSRTFFIASFLYTKRIFSCPLQVHSITDAYLEVRHNITEENVLFHKRKQCNDSKPHLSNSAVLLDIRERYQNIKSNQRAS